MLLVATIAAVVDAIAFFCLLNASAITEKSFIDVKKR
jgi:hypothetical protein